MTRLRRAGLRPNSTIAIDRADGKVKLGDGDRAVALDDTIAGHVFVDSPA
jgi:hypothetical protein